MYPYIVCFGCGREVGSLYPYYTKGIKEGKTAKELLDKLELHRDCCRTRMLTFRRFNEYYYASSKNQIYKPADKEVLKSHEN